MADFLKLTAKAFRNTADQTNNYSKIGAVPPGQIKSSYLSNAKNGLLTAEEIARLKCDLQELSLDLTQLGLTVVGLIEVAEPIQISADLANAAIDFGRGHPVIGTFSALSATPILGLLSGIGLTGIRVVRVLWNTLKFLGKSFFIIAKAGICKANAFIFTKGQRLLTYFPTKGQVVESVLQTGDSIGKFMSDGIPAFTEGLKKILVKIGNALTKAPVEPITIKQTNGLQNAIETNIKNAKKVDSGYNPKTATEARKYINTYRQFPNTFGNIRKFGL